MIRFWLPGLLAMMLTGIALLDVLEVLPGGSATSAVLFVPLAVALSGQRCTRRTRCKEA